MKIWLPRIWTTNLNQNIQKFAKRTEKTCEFSVAKELGESQVKKRLQELNDRKTGGPDGINSFFLLNCAGSFSYPLSKVFGKSLESGVLPKIWKKANVSPLHKSGPKLFRTNYRAISITCIPCKVLERIIKEVILMFLIANKLMSADQLGFLPNRSCITNLI